MLYGSHSFRGGAGVTLDEVRDLSFAWRDLLSLGWPQAVGYGGAGYWGGLGDTDYPRFVGASVLALAGIAIVRGGVRTANDRLWLALALFGIVFSIGARLGPLYSLMSHVLPFASRFRVASAVLFVAELALVLVAARAFVPAAGAAAAGTGRGGMSRPLAIGIGGGVLLPRLGPAVGAPPAPLPGAADAGPPGGGGPPPGAAPPAA